MHRYFDLIPNYFPELSDKQLDQFGQLWDFYHDWNSQINVISRKDIDELYLRHVLHSLSIAKVFKFNKGAEILDVGTGGGFPGSRFLSQCSSTFRAALVLPVALPTYTYSVCPIKVPELSARHSLPCWHLALLLSNRS